MHDQGFAQIPIAALDAASNITLQAWGRIEGRLVLDSQPVPNEHIFVGHQISRYDEQGRRFGFLTFGFETTTDSDGKFAFEKVPPGPCAVWRQIYGPDHRTQVVIKPGADIQVAVSYTHLLLCATFAA